MSRLPDLDPEKLTPDQRRVYDDIAAGPVYNLDQAPDDPQISHNGMVLKMEHSLGGEIRLINTPIKMASVDPQEYTSPPTLGQHTREVLSGLLHYSPEQIEKLEAEQQENLKELKKRVARTS